MGAIDTIVIGGGPSGSAAAIGLARAGRRVVLLERTRVASDKVCGEFLSVEACDEARALGVDPLALGAAQIDRVRVSCGATTVESALPFRAASCSRRIFDEALLDAATAAGAGVRRGVRAVSTTSATMPQWRTVVRGDAEDDVVSSQSVVLATGKDQLSGFRRSGGHFPDALGFKMHLRLSAHEYDAIGDGVELSLFAGGYAGMQRIEGDTVALALVVRRDAYAAIGSWPALVDALKRASPSAARRLRDARELWPKPLAISGVPYGFIYRDAPGEHDDRGPYRVGDQLAVIPSFTGDGMAIALVTGACAARAIVRGDTPAAFHASMRARLAKPMTVAGVLSRAIASPAGRAAVMWPARIVPRIFSLVAAQTRIPRALPPE